MKYKCEICEAEFDEPRVYEEKDPLYEGGVYVSLCCPECGEQDIDEGVECKLCGAWSENGICDDCAERLENNFLSLLHDTFTSEEIEALNEIFEGRYIE